MSSFWRLLSLVIVVILLPADAAREEALNAASACLQELGTVKVQCGKQSQKIRIRSVSYAYTPNCNEPSEDNDCVQVSAELTENAMQLCNGQNSCELDVISIDELQVSQRLNLNSENIEHTLSTCSVDKTLQLNVTMNLFQVKFECEDFEFCSDVSSEATQLTIATPNWPESITTNPNCSCVFESADQEQYCLNGYVHCNGTVTFISKETYIDGTSQTLEYKCENKFNEKIILIGSQEPYRIEVSVDIEKSDEETGYEISWYNIDTVTKRRNHGEPVKVECASPTAIQSSTATPSGGEMSGLTTVLLASTAITLLYV